MKIACIIPARFASKRLPGKPLLNIGGIPMIEWVYRRARKVKKFESVIVATDNAEIYNHIQSIGGESRMTPEDLPSGTDRVARVAQDLNVDVIVNLQGDEPLIIPEVLEQVCVPFEDAKVEMTTPVSVFNSNDELKNPNLGRVVVDNVGDAIYFSRAVIPYWRDIEDTDLWLNRHTYYKHIGIYAYRKDLRESLYSCRF